MSEETICWGEGISKGGRIALEKEYHAIEGDASNAKLA